LPAAAGARPEPDASAPAFAGTTGREVDAAAASSDNALPLCGHDSHPEPGRRVRGQRSLTAKRTTPFITN